MIEPTANHPATPPGSASATPQVNQGEPTGGMSVSDLAKKMEEMEARMGEKDRVIQELQADRSTLEQRINSINSTPAPAPAGNPASAGMDANQIAEIIERQTYVNEVRKQNADLIELKMEPSITNRAAELMNSSKKPFRDAIDQAIKEHREIVEKKLKVTQPVPPGAQGETPANIPPVTPPPEPEKQLGDEGDERIKRRAKLGL